jgi:hypothetical protein
MLVRLACHVNIYDAFFIAQALFSNYLVDEAGRASTTRFPDEVKRTLFHTLVVFISDNLGEII